MEMFRVAIFLLSLLHLCFCADYRKDGKFVLGAILPLSQPDGAGKCTAPNAQAIAVADTYVNAIERLKLDDHFREAFATYDNMIGYDIRDDCHDSGNEKDIAYDFGKEVLAYSKDQTLPKPPDVILSEFTEASLQTIYVLNAENLPQISYAQDNAKLTADKDTAKQIATLASAYPDNIMKMTVVACLLKEYKFNYIHVIVSNDHQGNAGLMSIKEHLKSTNTLTSDHLISSKPEHIQKVVDEIKKNPLVTVAVIHCTKAAEIALYEALAKENITGINFISTQNWHLDQATLKRFPSVVEGMIYVQYEDEYKSIEGYFTGAKISIPFDGKDWIKPLFKSLGGDDKCVTPGATLSSAESQACDKAEKDTRLALAAHAEKAVNSFIATYVIMNAVKSKKQDESLTDAMKGLQFKVGFLPQNVFEVSNDLTLDVTIYKLYNIQHSSTNDLVSKWVGHYDETTAVQYQSPLRLSKKEISWKNGAKETPDSNCAAPCKLGFKMIRTPTCWECLQCPNGTISNVTNAKKCLTCPAYTSPKPDQSGCEKYKLLTFHWFGAMGSVVIFLIVVGVCCVLFGLGILSQNSDHELVQLVGYKLMCVYLLGCLILFLSPVPLLVVPTVSSCSAYISFFNLGVTLCFAVLMARSALVNGFYDEEGNVTGGCSSRPRAVFVIIIVGIQGLIMLIGLLVLPPKTLHNDTMKWNERYFECSSWSSYVFWVGFGYNIAISIVGNCLSCSSTKVLEVCSELKYILITYCLFYLVALFEVVIFYRYVDEQLAEAQAFMCIIFGLLFFFAYIWPKLYWILFHKDEEIMKQGLLNDQDDHPHHPHLHATAHASDGFRHHGVIQMRIKEEQEDD